MISRRRVSASGRYYGLLTKGCGRLGALAVVVPVLLGALTRTACAQTAAPEHSQGWATVSTVSLVIGASSQLLMPRVFYSDTEATVGWKARWHVSVLAPAMTLTAVTLFSEYAIKPKLEGYRPGCDGSNQGGPGCSTFGAPSSHALGSFAALGQGTGVFLVDTLKWNEGRFNAGAFVGNVAVPLVASGFVLIGRVAGGTSWESGGQLFAGAGAGFGLGLLTGVAYAFLQRPECGYDAGIVCW